MPPNPNYKEALTEYFSKREEVLCAYLFGSQARGRGNSHSDVDIAILYDESIPPAEYTDRQITLSIEISQQLDKNTDIIILNRASPYLKFQVIREGARIYEKPTRVGRAFEARSIIEYFDFLPVKNLLESALIKRIKEA